jgi:hypothetical protein
MRRLRLAASATALLWCLVAPASRSEPPCRRQANAPSSQLIDWLAAARKPAVGEPLIIAGTEVCGPKGNSKNSRMQQLDNEKNRTDEPAPTEYISIGWEEMKDLPASDAGKIQGAPVSVIGYLSHRVNVEDKGHGESTNCNLLLPDEVDWHMYLTDQPSQPIRDAIIVETTPRVRPNHKWTTRMLAPYVNADRRVRISGWLMYDFQHLNVVGSERATVWEVHPITRIEIEDAQGNWTNIEQ